MSRGAPQRIDPIVHDGIRYEAPWSDRGVLIAKEVNSGKELWRLLVVDYWINPVVETDVQEVYFKSMVLQSSGTQILVVDEVGVSHLVDLPKRKASILNWAVTVRIVEWRPTPKGWNYWVQLNVTNSLNRDLLLDPVSVAKDGDVNNQLFKVNVDGSDVQYMGAMMKRAPPDRSEFIFLRPGESYEVRVELSDLYRVPAGDHNVSVVFEHTNHFSPDGFVMRSVADVQTFEGDGHQIGIRPIAP